MPNFQLTEPPAAVRIKAKNGRAICPQCGRRTETAVGPDTVLINFPLYCKYCRRNFTGSYGVPEPECQCH